MNLNPYAKSFTPEAANATAFATGLTGAGPFTNFAAGITDGMVHKITLTSTANLSGITLTLNGLDENGNAVSETIAGPNATTATSAKFYSSLTSITASSTLGANTMNVGVAAECATPFVDIDYRQQSFSASAAVVLTAGTIDYDVQHTYAAPLASNSPTFNKLAAQTTSQEVAYSAPIVGVRAHIISNTGAVFTLYAVQGARS